MTDFIIDLIAWGGYLGIFVLMVIENVFPPVPSEVIMGLGGIAVARGRMEIVPLMIAGTAGTVIGNVFWYEISHRLGYERFQPLIDRWSRVLTMEWQDVEQWRHFFVRHGHWVVFVFRFMPFGRTVISIPAGLTRMPRGKFIVWTAVGAAIWNAVLVGAGYWLGTNFGALDRYLGPATIICIVAMVLGYGWRVATWRPRSE